MKKIGWLPVILLGASTLSLLALFILKAVNNRNVLIEIGQTQTVVVGTDWAEQTIAAIPTETPLPTATSTPEPTPTPLPPTATQAPTPTEENLVEEGCDEAAFVADVSFPDGTEIGPAQNFTKTWRLLNAGTCTWNQNYKLYFVSGDEMSGPASQRFVRIDVPPGASIDISIDLVSPSEPGTYRGYWGIKNAEDVEFGIGPAGQAFYVEITVVK